MSQYDYERYSPSYDHLPQNIHYSPAKYDLHYGSDINHSKNALNLTADYQPKHPAVKWFFTAVKIIFATMVLLSVAIGVSS